MRAFNVMGLGWGGIVASVVSGGLLFGGCSVDDKNGYKFGENGGTAGASGSTAGGKVAAGGKASGGRASGTSGGSAGAAGMSGGDVGAGDANSSGGTAPTGEDGGSAGMADTGPGVTPIPVGCGNAQIDPGEDCDDGPSNNDDRDGACNTHCKVNLCGAGSTESCAASGAKGNCAAGTRTCVNGAFSACSITPKSKDTCAEGDDANCDGTPNDGCSCVTGKQRSCAAGGAKGNCASGVQVCQADGTYGTCSIEKTSADSCSIVGDDANCDGTPNGGCPCVDGQEMFCGPAEDKGICKRGVSKCANSTWSTTCTGAVYAKARDCSSSLDNDCDGKPDNTVDSVCKCAPGSAAQECGQHPGQDGKGRCVAGHQDCVLAADKTSSSWGACTGSVGPATADSCVTKDDDANCDGVKNGGCACLSGDTTTCGAKYSSKGLCASRTLTCTTSGTWPANTACAPTGPEVCNASTKDEDCDGVDDEADACNDCPATNPCQHSGTCVDGDHTFTCACTGNYTGSRCETPILTWLGWPSGTSSCESGDLSGDGNWLYAECDGTPYRWSRSTGWIGIQGNRHLSGMNLDGTQAANSDQVNGSGPYLAYRWTTTQGAVKLPTLTSTDTYALGISDDGNIIAGGDGTANRLLKWTGTATPVSIKAPTGASDLWNNTTLLSGDGSTVIGFDGNTTIRWTGTGTGVFLDQTRTAMPLDVNYDGKVVVGQSSFSLPLPWVWTATGGFVTLENQGLGGRARGVSKDGSLIVGELGGLDSGLGIEAAFWTSPSASATRLMAYLNGKNVPGTTGTVNTRLFRVSRDGKIAMGDGNPSSTTNRQMFVVVFP